MTDLGLNDVILDIKNYDFVRAEALNKGQGLISGKGRKIGISFLALMRFELAPIHAG